MPMQRSQLSAVRTGIASAIMAMVGLAPLSAQTFTTLHRFQITEAASPQTALIVVGSDLYGTAFQGGRSSCFYCGTVFRVNSADGATTVLHQFANGPGDGAFPQGGLVYHAGQLYGTTGQGGAKEQGTVFALDLSGAHEHLLYSFTGGADGYDPWAGLTWLPGPPGVAGLYGTTSFTVFRANPHTGALTTIHAIGGSDGMFPDAPFAVLNGNLFSTMGEGGPGSGNVYRVTPASGALRVLHYFHSIAQSWPTGIAVHDGLLYSTTYSGGHKASDCSDGCGTVFSVDARTGAEKTLYAFKGGADGRNPQSGVIYVGGKLYGTTRGVNSGCDTNGCGTIFEVDAVTGSERVLYRFRGGADGGLSIGGLVQAGGYLYGTTTLGGDFTCSGGCGTVFRLKP